MSGGALAGLLALPWLSVAPNRLLPGQGIAAIEALGTNAVLAAALILLAAAANLWRRAAPGVALAFALLALAVLLVATGLAAGTLLAGRPPAARAMLGAGFWTSAAALTLLVVEEARAVRRPWVPVAAALALLGTFGVAAAGGLFDALSLAVELRARAEILATALLRHVALSAAALALALAFAVPLSWAALRSPRAEAAIGAVLSAFQVIPALALFGLLIPLIAALLATAPALRGLGLSAIGPTPALAGVALYLALPLLRGLVSGLRAADPAVVEAARAMGMSEGRITAGVRIPLGLPVLVGALRLAAVQSIGLVTLGGLIGAGGLGAVVFEGMSQLAPDLILLGAVPVIALALATDGVLARVQAHVPGRRP